MQRCARFLLAAMAIVASMWVGDPAHADTGPTDLKVSADPAKGKVGGLVKVDLHFYNLGPGDTQPEQVKWEYTAPVGAELLGFSNHLEPDPNFYVTAAATRTTETRSC
jgi:hypothetical protein